MERRHPQSNERISSTKKRQKVWELHKNGATSNSTCRAVPAEPEMAARTEKLSKRLLAVVPESETQALHEGARLAGAEPVVFHRLSDGLARAREGWDAVVLSLTVESSDLATANRVGEQPGVAALLLSAPQSTLALAVEARRSGAGAVLVEPLDARVLATELQRLFARGERVPLPELPGDDGQTRLLGSSPAIAKVYDVIARVADTQATVLITGESGTGKELVARSLHDAGGRRGEPFVAVNCAAIPEHLLESELFGHERGAFTGAVAQKAGRFERAHGGTLFLDEIGDMSLVLQAKILRALEERAVERVGGTATVKVDVRVVAATNRALPERIAQGSFREDLYYRLAVIEVQLPPLRDRVEDIEPLALHFAAFFSRTYGRPVRGVSREALRRIVAYPWPGNVRELRNVMDRAVLLCRGTVLAPEDLVLGEAAPRGSPRDAGEASGYAATLSLAEVEARHIRSALLRSGGHLGDASRTLGIHRNTLARKIREYGLDATE
jgi:DNA-binding NtrC family response regulator